MKITRVKIKNFRGISEGEVFFSDHNVLVGDNNIGKSSILEAIDLVLGPERLSRTSIIDEHDFYAGEYLDLNGDPKCIDIEVVVTNLTQEQESYFKDHLEWWDKNTNTILDQAPIEDTDKESVTSALRLGFKGFYDKEEDDFDGNTYYLNPPLEDGGFIKFKTVDKRLCGFLYLRTLRTGSRALSLERGSLLDIILKLQDKHLQIWEDVLSELRELPVADKPELGIHDILSSVQNSVRLFIPSDGMDNPHIKVSDLTRENLRKTLTAFMDTGAKKEDGSPYSAPFQHQGTGTINVLVLALLSLIAELKQNVIFAMEEPEIAIPPHTQKSIISDICRKSTQAIFTSHSPYVLEEFNPAEILVLKKEKGVLSSVPAEFTSIIKPKAYRFEFRKRFTEALLARRVLITEGPTEYDAFRSATRRLHELQPEEFKALEALGVAIISADTDSQIAPIGELFNKLGKETFAVFDLQTDNTQRADIMAKVKYPYESTYAGCEELIVEETSEDALRRFALLTVSDGDWPLHLKSQTPTLSTPIGTLKTVLINYFGASKGAGTVANLLEQCSRDEMPRFIVETLLSIQKNIEPLKSEFIAEVSLNVEDVTGKE
ncbi:MAG: hypothetical protein RL292_560 [Candidatus Parcubacteria bacterium]